MKRGKSRCIGALSTSANAVLKAWAHVPTMQELECVETLVRQARSARDAERRVHYAQVLPMAVEFASA